MKNLLPLMEYNLFKFNPRKSNKTKIIQNYEFYHY